MAHEREVRTITTSLRAATRNGKRVLSGRAAAFGTVSHDLGGFREVIARDAFHNALVRGDETILTFNHIPSTILARTRNGSLRLQQSTGGLDFEADLLSGSQTADEVWTLVTGGLVTECSFAFTCDKDSWPDERKLRDVFGGINLPNDGLPVRMVEDLHLYDCSVVCTPAYPEGTGVAPRMPTDAVSSLAIAEARNRGGYGSVAHEDEARRRRAHAWGERIRRDDLAARFRESGQVSEALFWEQGGWSRIGGK